MKMMCPLLARRRIPTLRIKPRANSFLYALDHSLILGEAHLRAVLTEYQAHYNTARPHQGIAQRVPNGEHDPRPIAASDPDRARIHRKPVLNGLINEYIRAA